MLNSRRLGVTGGTSGAGDVRMIVDDGAHFKIDVDERIDVVLAVLLHRFEELFIAMVSELPDLEGKLVFSVLGPQGVREGLKAVRGER